MLYQWKGSLRRRRGRLKATHETPQPLPTIHLKIPIYTFISDGIYFSLLRVTVRSLHELRSNFDKQAVYKTAVGRRYVVFVCAFHGIPILRTWFVSPPQNALGTYASGNRKIKRSDSTEMAIMPILKPPVSVVLGSCGPPPTASRRFNPMATVKTGGLPTIMPSIIKAEL